MSHPLTKEYDEELHAIPVRIISDTKPDNQEDVVGLTAPEFSIPSSYALTGNETGPNVRQILGLQPRRKRALIIVNAAFNAAVQQPLNGVFSGADTGGQSASITASAGMTPYITGFRVDGLGATAATNVTVTITGTSSGTLSYTYSFVAGATTPNTPLDVKLPVPIASSVGGTITVSVPGAAGNTNTNINLYGYQSSGASTGNAGFVLIGSKEMMQNYNPSSGVVPQGAMMTAGQAISVEGQSAYWVAADGSHPMTVSVIEERYQ